MVIELKNLDILYMKRALLLAETQGRYVSPNPKVGAILVKNGKIVAEGAHQRYGGPHAEIVALKKAGLKAKGATLYVTLEPCSHYGKTPPCANALIKAGIVKVVSAMKDPFPLVAGKGFGLLRKAGIKVKTGLFEADSKKLNENFVFSQVHQRPKVILKAAMTLDGKIATVSGKSKWITGLLALRKAHQMRSSVDAILVGSRTAFMDNPSLTVRLPNYHREDGWPLRVLLDSHLRVKLSANIFQDFPKTLVFTSPHASFVREKVLLQKGIQVFRVPLKEKMLSLEAVLKTLYSLSVRSVLVEGGAEIHASFLKLKLADELALFIAPKIFGGPAPGWVGGAGALNPSKAWMARNIDIEKLGEDYLLTARLRE
jgi:diaminohydroxyphosphoribosylaminopyrimidine deaminase/5-amino-6-(5-phosphoribosylamino)uracil reductase